MLENLVYLELCRRGYKVATGKTRSGEIDFVATKHSETYYFQVAESLQDPQVRERELSAFLAVNDNYPKVVITSDHPLTDDINGIKHYNIVDWLLKRVGN
jgi:predicted AAA+ superfamily ATPase